MMNKAFGLVFSQPPAPIHRPIRWRSDLLYFLMAAAIAAAVFAWTYKYVRIVYAINDDVTFAKIASGSFSGTPDGHLIYLQYILGWMISRLYFLSRTIDWYGIALLGFLCACLTLILFRALSLAGTLKRQIASVAVVLVFYIISGLQQVAVFQFTTVSAALAGTAIFWLCTSDPRTGYARFVDPAVCTLLMLCSYMVRSNVFLLSLPFAAVAFLYKNLDWSSRRVYGLALPASVLVGAGAIFLAEQAAYHAPQWKYYLQLNAMDTQIYDYCGLPNYESNEEFYQSIGVSSATYELLSRYTLVPNPAVNLETYAAIVSRCRTLEAARLAGTPFVSRFNSLSDRLFNSMLDTEFALTSMLCLALFLFLGTQRWNRLAGREAFLLFAIAMMHFGVWIYLITQGRYPDRVIWAVLLVELLLLSSIALKDVQSIEAHANRRWQIAFGALAIVLAAGLINYQVRVVRRAVSRMANDNKGCERVYGYAALHPDNFYFLSTRSFAYCTKTFTINADGHIDNYTFMGDFDFYSPPILANWQKNGLGDIQQDLVGRDNVFVLIRPPDSIEPVVNYYRSIGSNVLADDVDAIDTGDPSNQVIVYRLGVLGDSPN